MIITSKPKPAKRRKKSAVAGSDSDWYTLHTDTGNHQRLCIRATHRWILRAERRWESSPVESRLQFYFVTTEINEDVESLFIISCCEEADERQGPWVAWNSLTTVWFLATYEGQLAHFCNLKRIVLGRSPHDFLQIDFVQSCNMEANVVNLIGWNSKSLTEWLGCRV